MVARWLSWFAIGIRGAARALPEDQETHLESCVSERSEEGRALRNGGVTYRSKPTQLSQTRFRFRASSVLESPRVDDPSRLAHAVCAIRMARPAVIHVLCGLSVQCRYRLRSIRHWTISSGAGLQRKASSRTSPQARRKKQLLSLSRQSFCVSSFRCTAKAKTMFNMLNLTSGLGLGSTGGFE